jgi:hypothetical protein
LTSDDNAFNFALQYRDTLFTNTPIVFCGVNNFSMKRLQGQHDITGVVEDVDFIGTTRLILQLFPETKTIAVISDITPTGDLHKKKFEDDVVTELSGVVKFKRLYRLTAERLSEELKKLPDKSPVFTLTFWRDPTGRSLNHRSLNHRESNTLIVGSSTGPVFTAWDHTVVHGFLGGLVADGRMQGIIAAKMVKRILNGEKASNIAIVEKSPNTPMFDFAAMQRFGLKKDDLPKGSTILNEPETLYYQYKQLIWVVLAFLALQMLVIFLLVAQVIKRKMAQEALVKSEKRFRSLLELSPLPMAVNDKLGNIIFLNDKYSEVFG